MFPTETSIKGVHLVGDGIYRGPRLDEVTLHKVIDTLSISTIVNLESDNLYVYNEKLSLPTPPAGGISFKSFPMSELWPPSRKFLRNMCRVLTGSRKCVYVHCRRGIDRTGIVIAAYRMLAEKVPFEQAYEECLYYGHSPVFYFHWKPVLKGLTW